MISSPEEAMDAITSLLEDNAGLLGIGYVGYGNERTIPSYPAVIVMPGVVDRTLHATHQFRIMLVVNMWVYHAKLSVSRKIRTREDLQLATGVRELLHEPQNMELRDENGAKQVIWGYIDHEEPGTILTQGKQVPVIATRMSWLGMSVKTF